MSINSDTFYKDLFNPDLNKQQQPIYNTKVEKSTSVVPYRLLDINTYSIQFKCYDHIFNTTYYTDQYNNILNTIPKNNNISCEIYLEYKKFIENLENQYFVNISNTISNYINNQLVSIINQDLKTDVINYITQNFPNNPFENNDELTDKQKEDIESIYYAFDYIINNTIRINLISSKKRKKIIMYLQELKIPSDVIQRFKEIDQKIK